MNFTAMPWPLRMVTYATIILLLLFAYFSFRYFRSIDLVDPEYAWAYKIIYGITTLLFFAYPVWGLIQYGLTGIYTHTGFPKPLIYLFWFGLIFSGVMLNWGILHDLLLPLFKRFSPYPSGWLDLRFAKLFLIFTCVTFIFTASKLIWDTHRITTVPLEHAIAVADVDFKPLRVIHITDLHADIYTEVDKLNRYVNRINELEPDIVLFGGDLISSGPDHINAGAAALGQIKSKYGTFAVLGDHDYWYQPEDIVKRLNNQGIRVVRDENIRINHFGHTVRITGITELYSRMIPPAALTSLLDDRDDDSVNILFAHQVTDRIIQQSQQSDIHLLLGAHTHGGQIRIPIFFYKVTAARSETRYVNGHWFKDQMLLSVNNGLGFTLSPVRYNAPAQVTVITLTSR